MSGNSGPHQLVVARLKVNNNKRTKVADSTVFSDVFADDGSLSGLMLQEDGRGLISTGAGRLLYVEPYGEAEDAGVELLGEIGSGVAHLTYNAATRAFIAISTDQEEQDENGEQVITPGSLLIATPREAKDTPVAFSIAQMLSPSARPLAKGVPSIRRPCNLGR